MFGSCARQSEVETTVRAGQWPHGCDASLRAHVAGCRDCADLVLVAGAFQQARGGAVAKERLASPGALFWRAQIRRRNGAVERMARPIVVAEWVAFAAALLALGISVWQWSRGITWTQTWSGLMQFVSADASAASAGAHGPGMLLLSLAMVGALAVFGGVAVYLVTSRE
jgi:hypothetical protein